MSAITAIGRAAHRTIAAALGAALLAGCGSTATPTQLTTGEVSATSVKAQGGNVYWLQGNANGQQGALRTIPAGGGTARSLATIPAPRSLALTATAGLVGTNSGDVYTVDLASGASSILIPAQENDPVVALAIGGDAVYAALNSGALVRGSATSAGDFMQLDSVSDAITFLATDGHHLYWGTEDGSISREPADGSGSASLLGSLDGNGASPGSPVIVGGSLYFCTPTYVASIDLITGTLATVLQDVATGRSALNAWGLATDGTSLFIGQRYGLGRIDPAQRTSSIFLSDSVAGSSLAADSKYVYWISGSIDLYGNPVQGFTVFRGTY